MKQRTKGFRTLLALVLALAMVMGTALSALADYIYVKNGKVYLNGEYDETLTQKLKLEGNLEGYWNVLDVESFDDDETGDKAQPSSFTVTGDVKAEGDAVYVYAENGGTAAATVGGNAAAVNDTVEVESYEGGTASAEITGAVTATDIETDYDDANAYAVDGCSTGKGSSTDIHAAGGATAEAASSNDGTYTYNEVEAYAVSASSDEGGSTTVTVDQKADAAASTKGGSYDNEAEAYAVSASSDDGSTTEVTVNGPASAAATAEGKNPEASAYAVYASSDDEGKTTVTVNGDAKASATAATSSTGWSDSAQAIAVAAYSESGGTTEVTVTGKASASATASGEDAFAMAVSVGATAVGENSSSSVTVGGGADGLIAGQAYMGGSVTVDITGDTTVNMDESGMYMDELSMMFGSSSAGASFIAEGKDSGVDFTLTGALNVSGEPIEPEYMPAVTGAGFTAADEASFKATITGEIVTENTDAENGYAVGMEIRSLGADMQVRIDAAEESAVLATGGEDSAGVIVNVDGGMMITGGTVGERTDVDLSQVTGRFIYVDEDGRPRGMIYAIGTGEETEYYMIQGLGLAGSGSGVLGSADPLLNAVHVPGYKIEGAERVVESGSAIVDIQGDVTGEGTGVELKADKKQKANVIVDGTVSGDRANIVLIGDTQLDDNVTLTVWQVVPDENDAIIYRAETDPRQSKNGGEIGPLWTSDPEGEDGEGTETTALTADKESEKKLQYIIRVEDKTQQYLASLDGARKVAGIDREYDVAKEGETVTMKLNIPEGYEITGAYGDVDKKVKLEKDANGNYFLTVPRGGGVYLAVTLTKLPDPEPDPEPAPEPDEPDTVAITYILGNDTQYDHIRTTAAVGEGVALQPAPERDGYTFLYWQCTDVDPSSSYYQAPDPENDFQFRPGAIYTAKKDINFVAVWKQN